MSSLKRGAQEDAAADGTVDEREPTARSAPRSTPRRRAHVNGENYALMPTPQTGTPSNASPSTTVASSRPVTRSARKAEYGLLLPQNPSIPSQVHERLRIATTSNSAPSIATSNLEDALDIDYGSTGVNHGVDARGSVLEDAEHQITPADPQNDQLEESDLRVSGSHTLRRSARIRAKAGATRELSPSTIISPILCNANRIRKRQRRDSTQMGSILGQLRRSARLAKPLSVFHKYQELPGELKLMIWEAVVEPRLVYICNKSSVLGHTHSFGVQNMFPPWFMACRASLYIAKSCYLKLFGTTIHPAIGSPLRRQDINPWVDIVIFEPCHNGCRAFYCAQQYSEEDRAAVQRLAVQIDSPHLPPTSEPGWVTVSRSWPNVRTLFMMKAAVRGPNQGAKAMIRIKEGDHEVALRKVFEEWKKEAGRDHKLSVLEFVRVVEHEPRTKKAQDRYQSVEDRKTGLVEDIILG
ncbi:hypothetical protein SAMD00023353_0601790 [Rosellinia necatrix]|uniref:2EXR domain-containing protein n=1 Tax=Rosellinia necatrix TaxID=77044 RepID=A0A1S7UL86_ROSNE|nr:hypothetical protein SAMD00023353_0601790 [Rosellinia necatrix]